MKKSTDIALVVGLAEIGKVYNGADRYWPNAPEGCTFSGAFRPALEGEKYLGTDGRIYDGPNPADSVDHRRLILVKG